MHLISEVGVGTTFWFDLIVYQEETISLDEDSHAVGSSRASRNAISLQVIMMFLGRDGD